MSVVLSDFRRQDLAHVATRISRQTGVSLDEMVSASRMPVVSRARQDLVLVLRAHHWTFAEIGAALGGRHHTTAMYELRKAQERQRAERQHQQETIAS